MNGCEVACTRKTIEREAMTIPSVFDLALSHYLFEK